MVKRKGWFRKKINLKIKSNQISSQVFENETMLKILEIQEK